MDDISVYLIFQSKFRAALRVCFTPKSISYMNTSAHLMMLHSDCRKRVSQKAIKYFMLYITEPLFVLCFLRVYT